MIEIKTVRHLINALPAGEVPVDPLMKNLAILSLAMDGKVQITGFKDGKLTSENTKAGRDAVVANAVAEMDAPDEGSTT